MAYSHMPTPTANMSTQGHEVSLPFDDADTISSIRWSPVSDHLAAASWDGKTRIYEVASDGSGGRGVAMLTAEGPLLSCDWSKDGTMVTAAGADKKVHILSAATGASTSFAAHDAPIRVVRFVNIPSASAPIIASGSWDQTVRYWDIRNTSTPVSTLLCGERVYDMDSGGPFLVIATAAMKYRIVDLHTNPTVFLRTQDSKLDRQIRSVSVSPTGKYWATGSINGRAAVQALDKQLADKVDFTWRCHRSRAENYNNVTKVWAVNAVAYHPHFEHTVATCGADGSFCFWDVDQHTRLKNFTDVGGAITSCAFDRTGKLFAYAIGYDWSMGYAHNTPEYPLKLMLHRCQEEELHRGKPLKTRGTKY